MDEGAEISIVVKHLVQPSSSSRNAAAAAAAAQGVERIHLAPWDLRLLSIHYIQKGLLFPKAQHKPFPLVVSDLLTSFSRAVDHFYPLAGRLHTTHLPDDDSSISISLDCTGEGAEFIHASALHVTISDIIGSGYMIPPVVHSFFPLNGAINFDGHSCPLLGVQVTELADSIFVGCSLNHSVGDGTAFWYFFKTWSAICRTGGEESIDSRPVFERWFPDFCSAPSLRLPFTDPGQFIRRVPLPRLPECAFEFSPESIKKLKARANKETAGSDVTISSLQSLLALVWRSATRARGLNPEQETGCRFPIGYRSRLRPPLPATYVGNALITFSAKATAGEIESKGLGRTALLLNRAVAEHGDEAAVHDMFESWSNKSPLFGSLEQYFGAGYLLTSSSPRHDVYGSDFGWGRPVAVRSGPATKVDGKVTVYPAAEEGGIAMEICLPAEVLRSLLRDEEFMAVVQA